MDTIDATFVLETYIKAIPYKFIVMEKFLKQFFEQEARFYEEDQVELSEYIYYCLFN